MSRVLIAGLVGGLVVFLWSAVSWMVLPFHGASLNNIPGETQATEEFLAALGESGVYHFPGLPPSPEQMSEYAERARSGPRVTMMVFRAEGSEPFPPINFVLNILAACAAATIAAALLATTTLAAYGQRILFVAALGLFVTLAELVPSWVWWSYPTDFAVAEVVDALVAWALAGTVIAKIAPKT